MTALIRIYGHEDYPYPLNEGWRIGDAITEICRAFSFRGGFIVKDGAATRSSDLIVEDGDYAFVSVQNATISGSGGEMSWLPEHPELDADLTDARDGYRQEGSQLAKHNTGYDEISDVLRSIRDTSARASPFIVIVAPSCTGKTQLGFTLAHLDFQVLHCTLYPSSSTDRRVNRTMANVSANIGKAVTADTRGITQPDASELQVEALWDRRDPLRLIQYFFRYFMDDTDRPLYRCTVSELRTALGKRPVWGRLPVVVVDEVGNSRDARGEVIASDIIRAQYICNLCRALRVPCVLMGTNSNVMNMIPVAARSPTENMAERWCTLISRLPRVVPQSQEALGLPSVLAILRDRGHPALAAVLDETSRTANPLFLVSLVDDIRFATESQWQQWGTTSSRDILDDLLATMATWVFKRNEHLLTPAGQHGQFALQLNMYHGWKPQLRSLLHTKVLDTTRADLVASHFAMLNAPRAVTDLFWNGRTLKCNLDANKISSDLQPWWPSASFPTATSDPWLHLFCGGGKGDHPPAFHAKDGSGAAMSTADALVAIRRHAAAATQQRADLSSTEAPTRDGDVLEALVGVAMVTASRRNGVGGMSLSHFLCRLAEELILSGDANRQRAVVTWRGEPLVDGWLGEVLEAKGVPYLGALNADWPDSLLGVPGCHFGHCRRSSDAEEKCRRVSVSVRRCSTLVRSAVAEAVSAAKEAPSSVSSPQPVEDAIILCECKTDSIPLNQEHVEEVLLYALDRYRTDAHHRVHLVFASKLATNPLADTSSWEAWKATNATGVHLQVAHLVVAREEATNVLSLSMANLCATMPQPHAGCQCDVLVLFIAVEDWLSVVQPTMSKEVRSALGLGSDDEDETPSPARKKLRKG